MTISSYLRTLALTSTVVLASMGAAHAQYMGPGATPVAKSVAEVLKNPVNDEHVTLTGQLVRKISDDDYMFSDGTGEIKVDIDQKYFPAQPVDDKTRVQLRGEVEVKRNGTTEIDVKGMSVL